MAELFLDNRRQSRKIRRETTTYRLRQSHSAADILKRTTSLPKVRISHTAEEATKHTDMRRVASCGNQQMSGLYVDEFTSERSVVSPSRCIGTPWAGGEYVQDVHCYPNHCFVRGRFSTSPCPNLTPMLSDVRQLTSDKCHRIKKGKRREYFQLPRHNNIRRGKVPHYTNFVSSISLADRDSTPSPPPHPRRAFEDAHHGRRELRRCVHRRKQPVEQMVKRKNEEFISVEDERDNDTEEELLKLVEDDVIIHDLTPDLIESEADQKTEPYAPTPTPLASPPLSPPPPPIEESQLEREPTPQPQTTTLPPSPPKEQQEPQPEEELQDELPIPEVTSLPAPEVILPTASISQERLDEPSSIEPVLEEDSIPPVTKKEVTFQQPFVQEHHFEDLETKEETTDVAESEVATEENGEEEANKDMEDKTEDDATQIETANSYDNQNPDDVVSNTNTSSANQTNSEEDDTKKRRPLGPAPKYKVDIFGMDAQSLKDLLDIEMRLRRRGAEPSPDSPDITDISDIDVKKPKMQTWLRGRLALSRQSSRFEIPMDVRVLESMTPMDYLLGYCRINKRRQAMYKKAFRKVDKDNDGVISLKEMEKGLNEIFVDSIEPEQVETLLDLLKIEQSVKLRSKMFCAISALTERLLFQQLTTEEAAELLNHKKERIEDADFSALDWKLEGCKIQPELRRLLYQL
ncbi:uncharacterized protein [Antedon mediterranea]|uniref:uncharacterized protein isoform X3 n=1 Tax=Antedon mediterranea TaxID=105859 RepID=UPI003AF49870